MICWRCRSWTRRTGCSASSASATSWTGRRGGGGEPGRGARGVTGGGRAAVGREQLGVRLTAGIMAILLLANWPTTIGDFAGVAGSLEIFRVPRLVGIPVVGLLVGGLMVRGGY